jgi:hypothetical protein
MKKRRDEKVWKDDLKKNAKEFHLNILFDHNHNHCHTSSYAKVDFGREKSLILSLLTKKGSHSSKHKEVQQEIHKGRWKSIPKLNTE